LKIESLDTLVARANTALKTQAGYRASYMEDREQQILRHECGSAASAHSFLTMMESLGLSTFVTPQNRPMVVLQNV